MARVLFQVACRCGWSACVRHPMATRPARFEVGSAKDCLNADTHEKEAARTFVPQEPYTGAPVTEFLTLQPVDALLRRIREFSILPEESVPLADCLGRTLAFPFLAGENLPGFERSTMDGFAVRARDVFGASEGAPALLEYAGECPMGAAPGIRLQTGQTARIWTGGMMPQGADAVVMLEYSRFVGDTQVELTRPAAPGDHVLARDEDARAGQELIPAGKVLRAQEIGLLAALGQATVSVRRRPRVAVISTGDEVLLLEETPLPGQVRDVNSYTLTALAQAAGAEARSFGLVRDNKDVLQEKIREALDFADVVLVSGGSSAGQRDYTVNAFAGLPGCEILAHGVAVSPGKPLIMAHIGEQSLWGMPGNVASALVCGEVFIRPLLRRLLGQGVDMPPWQASLTAELARPVSSTQGRRDYIRVTLEPPLRDGGPLLARPVMGKSGVISTLVKAEALIVCPEDQEGLAAGELVRFHLLL